MARRKGEIFYLAFWGILLWTLPAHGLVLFPKDSDPNFDGRLTTFQYAGHSIGKVKFNLAVTNDGDDWEDGDLQLTYQSFDWSRELKNWVFRATSAGQDSVPALETDQTAIFDSAQTFRTRWIRPDAWRASLLGGGKRVDKDQVIYDRTGWELTFKATGKNMNVEFKSDEGDEPTDSDVPKTPSEKGSKISIGVKGYFASGDPLYRISAIPADDAYPTGMGIFEGIDEEILNQIDYLVTPLVTVDGVNTPLSPSLFGRTNPELEYVPMQFDFLFGDEIYASDEITPEELLFDIRVPEDAKVGTYLYRLLFTPEFSPSPSQFPGQYPGFTAVDTVWGAFTVVPEPSTFLMGLFSMGGGVLFTIHRRRKN